jgi:uncharacterized protein (DUF433 family)
VDKYLYGVAMTRRSRARRNPSIFSSSTFSLLRFYFLFDMSADDLKGIIHSDPEIMGGTPVFVGTRVPPQNLIDSLEGGESIEDFLDSFPSVKREQVIAVIEAGKLRMLETV